MAEDNAANQELILALLHTRVSPESIQIANNGQEALKAATEEQFDLILMDIQMPHLGGIEVTTALRLIEGDRGGSHTPIIALTANAMKGDRETYLQSGMNGYVSKPINVDSLFLEIERVTQGQTRRNRKTGYGCFANNRAQSGYAGFVMSATGWRVLSASAIKSIGDQ